MSKINARSQYTGKTLLIAIGHKSRPANHRVLYETNGQSGESDQRRLQSCRAQGKTRYPLYA